MTAIKTPDQRVRVFISSTIRELAEERIAAQESIQKLRLIPVLFELGARPHPPKELYRAYLDQSHIFVGIYWNSYGWVAPDMNISGLEDEYRLAASKPQLIYVKHPADTRDSRLADLLLHIQNSNAACYRSFSSPGELKELLENDLAVLLSERFETEVAELASDSGATPNFLVPSIQSRLIGRGDEMLLLKKTVMDPEVVLTTITGIGGTGKSRISISVAHELKESFPDGVYFVPLANVGDPSLLRKTENVKTMKTVLRIITFLAFTALASRSSYARPIDPKQLDLLQKELGQYYEIQRNGGWPKITLNKKYYTRKQSAPEIKLVKQRLRASGDFQSSDTSSLFTEELSDAIKKVQKSFGISETGVIDVQLVKVLNVPVEKRIDQLLVNIERLKSLPAPAAGTNLVANIPEFKLHVYEGWNHVFDMAIVVGTAANKTVAFNDQMTHIIFSPYWNVPPSIVREEILPAARRNKNYLRNNGYEVTGTEGGLPAIRQKPGEGNSLGLVKFVFPNSHSIYFHDTPAKSLFKLNKRTFSHGCVRLAEPAKLAEYLLRDVPGWNAEKIEKAMKAGKEQRVNLPAAVPVVITYFTAWVDQQGLLNFREDIYGHDKEMARTLNRVAVK